MNAPNIFEYHDYRAYLTAWADFKRDTSSGFSLRSWSLRAGFNAPNFMGLVIRGKRNLSSSSIRKVVTSIKLKGDASEYFTNMVLMNQATTHDEKNHFYQKMSASKNYLEVHQLERDQYEFYSKWYYTVIREMIAMPNFRENPEWIARRLKPMIPIEEARRTIELLLRLELVKRNEEGKLEQTTPHLSTPEEVSHLSIANFHREMLHRAAEAIDVTHPKHRDISAITVSLTPDRLRMAKEKIQTFRRELHAILSEPGEGLQQAVYQINMQLFNVSETGDASA